MCPKIRVLRKLFLETKRTHRLIEAIQKLKWKLSSNQPKNHMQTMSSNQPKNHMQTTGTSDTWIAMGIHIGFRFTREESFQVFQLARSFWKSAVAITKSARGAGPAGGHATRKARSQFDCSTLCMAAAKFGRSTELWNQRNRETKTCQNKRAER